MNIVACASDNYTMQCGVLFYSVCKNNFDESICFFVITDKFFSDKHKDDIRKTISDFPNKTVEFIIVTDEQVDHFLQFENSYYTRHVFYRLLMADLLPKTVEKALYLDCDIIVRHSLKDLWNIDISNYAIGCIHDGLESEIEKFIRLGYSYDNGYFNSGVLYANLNYWRKTDASKRFALFIKNYGHLIVHPDQDVLNCVFLSEKLFIPFTYNAQSAFFYKKEFMQIDYIKYKDSIDSAVGDPVILHLSGVRPWVKGCEKIHPYGIEFFKYKENTIWKDFPQIRRSEIFTKKEYLKMMTIKYLRKFLSSIGLVSRNIDKYDHTLKLQ